MNTHESFSMKLHESRLLDAKIKYKETEYTLNNTNMEIKLVWEFETRSKESSVVLKVICKSIEGKANFVSFGQGLKKTTILDFKTDSTWDIKAIFADLVLSKDQIEFFPGQGIIDFDNKTAKIYF